VKIWRGSIVEALPTTEPPKKSSSAELKAFAQRCKFNVKGQMSRSQRKVIAAKHYNTAMDRFSDCKLGMTL